MPDATVLAVTDLAAAGDETVRQAFAFARPSGARVVVVHVLPEDVPADLLFPHGATAPAGAAALVEAATAAVQARTAELAGADAAFTVRVLDGQAQDALPALAAELGAGTVATPPGEVAKALARHHLGVLVVRPSPASGPVVGATDFSDAALPALRAAARAAAAAGTSLLAAHFVDIAPVAAVGGAGMIGGAAAVVPDTMLAELAADAEHRLTEALAGLGASGTAVVTMAPPAQGIVDLARDRGASLVVVGTHGRSGVARFLMGSVADHVASHAPCSVLVVPLVDESVTS